MRRDRAAVTSKEPRKSIDPISGEAFPFELFLLDLVTVEPSSR